MSEPDDGRTLRDRAGPSGATDVVVGPSGATDAMTHGAPDTVRESEAGVPRVGDVVADKYVVERVVGVGGMGHVLAVRHQRLDQVFAMKVLDPELAGDEDALARFAREARAMAALTSPYTVRIYDVAELPNKLPYLVMDYLDGEDLSRTLRREGPLAIEDAIRWIDQACEALEEAHAAGLVHRDLEPQNLFLAKDAKGNRAVRVLDFGIARSFGGKMGKLVTITRHGDVLGTLSYMAPEQIRSAKAVDPRSDIWAIGACLYRLLTNTRAFVAAGEGSLVEAILTKEPLPILEMRPEVPAGLALVVEKCLKKKPDERFASVTALRSGLQLALSSNDVVFADDGTAPMTRAPVRPPPVKSERVPATQPMPAVRLPTPPPLAVPVLPPQEVPASTPAKSRSTPYAAIAVVVAVIALAVAAVLHAMKG